MRKRKVKILMSEIFGDFWEMISNRFCISDTKLSLFYGCDELDCEVTQNGNQIDYIVLNKQGCPIYYIHKDLAEEGNCREVYYQEMGKGEIVGQAKLWRDNKGCYEQSLRNEVYNDGKQYCKELCCIQYGDHDREKCFIKVNISNLLTSNKGEVIQIKSVSYSELNPLGVISDEASIEVGQGRLNFNLKYDRMEEIIDRFNIYYKNPNLLKTRTVKSVFGKVEFDETHLPPMSITRIPYFSSFDKTKVGEHLNISKGTSTTQNIGDGEAEERTL